VPVAADIREVEQRLQALRKLQKASKETASGGPGADLRPARHHDRPKTPGVAAPNQQTTKKPHKNRISVAAPAQRRENETRKQFKARLCDVRMANMCSNLNRSHRSTIRADVAFFNSTFTGSRE